MSRVYYKGAMGALVVFDITNGQSLEAAARWKQDLDSQVCLQSGRPIPAVLLANKCDMKARENDLLSTLDRFCQEHSFAGWFETSAKVGVLIKDLIGTSQMVLGLNPVDSSGEFSWDNLIDYELEYYGIDANCCNGNVK